MSGRRPFHVFWGRRLGKREGIVLARVLHRRPLKGRVKVQPY